jgi:hypothetical protein
MSDLDAVRHAWRAVTDAAEVVAQDTTTVRLLIDPDTYTTTPATETALADYQHGVQLAADWLATGPPIVEADQISRIHTASHPRLGPRYGIWTDADTLTTFVRFMTDNAPHHLDFAEPDHYASSMISQYGPGVLDQLPPPARPLLWPVDDRLLDGFAAACHLALTQPGDDNP